LIAARLSRMRTAEARTDRLARCRVTIALRHLLGRLLGLAVVGVTVTAALPASATEGETDAGAALFASLLLARSKGTHVGPAASVFVRHGLTDAFDLAGELSFAFHPGVGTSRLGAHAGVHYVVDVARFRPHLGAMLGVEDVWTLSCDPRPSNLPDVDTPRPPLFACGHDLLPSGVVPFGIEYAPDAPWRVGFASRFGALPFRTQVPTMLFTVGLGASFSWTFDDEP
jgi:hypothetical protein